MNLPFSRRCVASLTVASLTFLGAAPREAFALGFGCAGVAGEVLFLDTVYGAATGLLGGGIVEAIRDDHNDWQKRIATGAAIGTGLGLALGVLEISLRDCSEPTRVRHTSLEPGLQRPTFLFVPPVSLVQAHDGGISYSAPGAGLRFLFLTR